MCRHGSNINAGAVWCSSTVGSGLHNRLNSNHCPGFLTYAYLSGRHVHCCVQVPISQAQESGSTGCSGVSSAVNFASVPAVYSDMPSSATSSCAIDAAVRLNFYWTYCRRDREQGRCACSFPASKVVPCLKYFQFFFHHATAALPRKKGDIRPGLSPFRKIFAGISRLVWIQT